jgi:hypothetical protein
MKNEKVERKKKTGKGGNKETGSGGNRWEQEEMAGKRRRLGRGEMLERERGRERERDGSKEEATEKNRKMKC